MFPAPDGAGFRVVVLSADSTAHRRLLVRARTRPGYAVEPTPLRTHVASRV